MTDFSGTAEQIRGLVNGLNPWPSATAELGGTQFKLHRAELREPSGAAPGTVTADREGIRVAAEGADVLITELQAPGGKRMKAADYLRGHPLSL